MYIIKALLLGSSMEEKVGVVHISNGYLKIWPHPQRAGQLHSKCHCQAIREEAKVHSACVSEGQTAASERYPLCVLKKSRDKKGQSLTQKKPVLLLNTLHWNFAYWNALELLNY